MAHTNVSAAPSSGAEPEFEAYNEMRVIDLNKLPGDPGFVVDSATGEPVEGARVSDATQGRGRVRLQPANASMEPLYPSEVEIRGIVRGVVRTL